MEHPTRRSPHRVPVELVGEPSPDARRPAGRSSTVRSAAASRATPKVSTSSISPLVHGQRGERSSVPTNGTTRMPLTNVCTAGSAPSRRGSDGSSPISSWASRSAVSARRLARVLQPAGERDLAGVPRQRGGAHREDSDGLGLEHERREHGGQAVARAGRRRGLGLERRGERGERVGV